jgi:hypothetical protein
MRVRFTAPFDWDVPEYRGRVTLHFKPGLRSVRRLCGEAAIKAGKAVEDGTENRRRPDARSAGSAGPHSPR